MSDTSQSQLDVMARYHQHRETMAHTLRLEHLPENWNASVTGYLVMAAAAADLYLDFPLDDDFDQAAPVFAPTSLTPVSVTLGDQV